MESFGRKPTIFISSTCYDLKQVRNNLKDVIEKELGFEALLSEHHSFPLDPSINTVENCLRVVKERADIFVLIIGTRYGYINETGKSVTNLEYLRAKEKGIPIYAFVDKKIVNNLSLWQDNPDMDFSSTVDNTGLFTFVENLRNIDSVWIHEFDYSEEISERLKHQIAYLFYDSLNYRKKLSLKKLSNNVLQTSPNAIQLVLEEPMLWEHRFFAEVLDDYLKINQDLKKDFKYDLFLEPSIVIQEYDKLFEWIDNKHSYILKIVDGLSSLINNALPTALGEPGVESDLDFLIYISRKISEIYVAILKWELELGNVLVPENAQKLVLSLSNISQSLIKDIEDFNEKNKKTFQEIPSLIVEGKQTYIDLVLELTETDFTDFIFQLNALKKELNIDFDSNIV